MENKKPIGIVDIFAGPGGLSEGFASVGSRSGRPFKIALSIERDAAAHRTLRLRSMVHELNSAEYQRYIDLLNSDVEPTEAVFKAEFPGKWKRAEEIARLWELSEEKRPETDKLLDSVTEDFEGRTGLIGGPPCQVYSLVGRSRNAGNKHYLGDSDPRHTLYKEYIHVLERLNPLFFVMENVKGMLSSKHQSQQIFPLVKRDLEGARKGYKLFALAPRNDDLGLLPAEMMPTDHRDFIVRMEDFGVPQKRHRIIILGIRNDIADGLSQSDMLQLRLDSSNGITRVRDVLRGLPAVRSGLSRVEDSDKRWASVIQDSVEEMIASELDEDIRRVLEEVREVLESGMEPRSRKSDELLSSEDADTSSALGFMLREGLTRLHHHETRAHIPGDLSRYIFAAAFAEARGYAPKSLDFPDSLAPDHKNWRSGHFSDRFRVQTWKDASSTITSHISKDGHYYIHPDPRQARSLTVREAARLQTFPDDYIFLGNRTQKYHQVGNAVPPFLAKQIALILKNQTLGLL